MLRWAWRLLSDARKSLQGRQSDFPLYGYAPCGREPCLIDGLSDADLEELNRMLPWKCFTTDNGGRRFGNRAWAGKRNLPEAIPDRRIKLMHEYFDLSDKRVLELGCFEGVHTIGLGDFAAEVIAVDARIENVVKTIVRCAAYGRHPDVRLCDVETQLSELQPLRADVIHHVGVLYHLRNPVEHLLALGSCARVGVMLDTHYCDPDRADAMYEHRGRRYRYMKYREAGRGDPFSGMYDHAKWLLLDDIIELLGIGGLTHCRIVERREERNGPRVLLFAKREDLR